MGAPDAEIAAFVAARQQQADVVAEQWLVHPLNQPVLRVLALIQSCFVFGFSGERCGFRWADAAVVMDWHDVTSDVRKRLPIAINAILRG